MINTNHDPRPTSEAFPKPNQNLNPVGVSKSTKENLATAHPPKPQGKNPKGLGLLPVSACLEENIVVDTNTIKLNFLNEMLSYELSKSPETLRGDFLKRHRITPEIRARMVG